MILRNFRLRSRARLLQCLVVVFLLITVWSWIQRPIPEEIRQHRIPDGDNGQVVFPGLVEKTSESTSMPAMREVQVPGDGRQIGENKPSPATKVILFAYYRGGSTFLGELFKENPDAFYWFEPLRPPVLKWQNSYSINEDLYLGAYDDTNVKMLPDRNLTYLSDILHEILNCDIHNLEDYVLDTPFVTHLWTMPKMESFVKCLKLERMLRRSGERNGVSTTAVQNCSHLMSSGCRESQLTALKVVRMNMIMAEKLLDRDPDIRIIYYIRDPRGMLLSRRQFNMHPKQATFYDQSSRNICRRMKDDLTVLKVLRQKYPNNIFVDSYENLAGNSSETADRIYQFLQRPIPREVKMWLRKSEKAGDKANPAKKTPYGTFGRNSTALANRWKDKLGPKIIDIVTNNCQEVLTMMNQFYDYNMYR